MKIEVLTSPLKLHLQDSYLKELQKINKGGIKGKNEIVGTITKNQLREIAETKLPDLNCSTVEAAMKTIEGTALNMGIKVED